MKITVGMTIWPRFLRRFEYLVETVTYARRNLALDGLELEWLAILESEKTDPETLLLTEKYLRAYNARIVVNEDKACLGTTLNLLQEHCQTSYMLYVQDDWKLGRPINLAEDVDFLEENPDFGMIRYKFNRVPEKHRKHISGEEPYQLVEISTETDNYYSDQPHLKRASFHEATGPYSTKNSMVCESEMNCRVQRMAQAEEPGMKIAGRGNGRGLFLHVGIESSMLEKVAMWKK